MFILCFFVLHFYTQEGGGCRCSVHCRKGEGQKQLLYLVSLLVVLFYITSYWFWLVWVIIGFCIGVKATKETWPTKLIRKIIKQIRKPCCQRMLEILSQPIGAQQWSWTDQSQALKQSTRASLPASGGGRSGISEYGVLEESFLRTSLFSKL